MTGRDRALFSWLFFLSGAAGLIYEVCWTRLLRLPMGNTVASLTTVLTAFMAGLALGSWFAGRRFSHAERPLRIYACLEAVIGIFCLALPFLVAGQQPFFRWVYRAFGDSLFVFHALRFLACGVVILVPATLMGATLPVLCRAFFDDPARIGRSIGWLYAVNAFGAVLGSLLAGFVLIPNLGQHGAIAVGVVTSLSVALVAWRASRTAVARGAGGTAKPPPARPARVAGPQAAPAVSQPAEGVLRTVLLVGYAVSGLAAMVLQIAWTRVLALAFGSSVYAFSVLVSAFILGLAIGSSIASRIADRMRSPALGFAVAELGIGFTALAMVPVFQHFPLWMLRIVPQLSQDFSRFQFAQFALAFAALLLPTMCMGACLPLVGRALARGIDGATETVGTAYSANALGTIVGAFAGGFLLLPGLGMHRTILVGAALNVGVGLVVLPRVLPLRRALGWVGAGAVALVAAVVLLPPFDAAVFTSGAYLYADRLTKMSAGTTLSAALQNENRILLNTEGTVSTITVKDNVGGTRSLFVNGKADASDGLDMATQHLAGDVPMLLHAAPRDVAVIGLASGVSAHAVAQYPGVRSIDCIEIAPEMAAACRLFDHVNGRILDDPRLHLIIQDGRNHLALTNRQYDVIVSEPSNPWIAGIASLFTQEFFQACFDRLRPGGVTCIWIQAYGLDLHALASVVRTFQSVFPETVLWETVFASDYQLVGSKGPLAVPYDALRARMQDPVVAASLARVGVQSPAELLGHYVTDAAGLRRFAAAGDVYHDDRNRLEFDAPRLLHRPTTLETVAGLQSLRQPGWPAWLQPPAGGLHGPEAAALAASQAAQREFWQGVRSMQGRDDRGATQHFLAALDGNPRLRDAWPKLLDTARATLHQPPASTDTAVAMAMHRRILALRPPIADFYNDYGVLLGAAGRLPEAEAVYRQAVVVRPHAVHTRLNLGTALVMEGRAAEAVEVFRAVLQDRPDHLRSRLMLGNLLLQTGDAAGAEREYRVATTDHPEAAAAWFSLGEALHRQGHTADAISAYEAAVGRDAHLNVAYNALADCYRQTGNAKQAAAARVKAGARP